MALNFRNFEIFQNNCQLVARFRVPDQLAVLRKAMWRACRERGVAFPDALWVPHVVLGKIVTTRTQLAKITCQQLKTLAPLEPASIASVTVLGKIPQQIALDWRMTASPEAAVDGAQAAGKSKILKDCEPVPPPKRSGSGMRRPQPFAASLSKTAA